MGLEICDHLWRIVFRLFKVDSELRIGQLDFDMEIFLLVGIVSTITACIIWLRL